MPLRPRLISNVIVLYVCNVLALFILPVNYYENFICAFGFSEDFLFADELPLNEEVGKFD
jgi:hypothetical protein